VGKPQGGMFERFVHSEVGGSIVLLATTIAALVWANSPWAERYFALVDTYVGVAWGGAAFKMSLGHWVADGLMVIFFFVVGLEIKRELVVGQLSSLRQATLPVAAAVGGAALPALIYVAFNGGGEAVRGWGVPMATDIAFALGVLALFGKRVPIGLKVFLTALAIADDLLAVGVIAVFYTESIRIVALLVAGGMLLLMAAASRAGVRALWVYGLLALATWAAVMASGVHATVAGVLIAMVVPVRANIEPSEFLERARRRLGELEGARLSRESPVLDPGQREALDDLYLAVDDMRPAGITLEQALHPVQAFIILPLFALFKAGVALGAGAGAALADPVALGIVIGLFAGKQAGILLASWLVVRRGLSPLPEGVTWAQLWGAGCLGGIGFTMAIFVSELAFTDAGVIATAKIAVLAASLVEGVWGFIVLSRALPREA